MVTKKTNQKLSVKASSTTFIQAMETIIDKAEDSKLSPQFFKDRTVRSMSEWLADQLGVTPCQAVLLSLFMNFCNDNRIELNDLANFTGCRMLSMLRFCPDIDALVSKGYLICRRRSDDEETYRIRREVLVAIRENRRYEPVPITGLGCQDLFLEIERLFSQRDNSELTYKMLVSALQKLLAKNSQLLFVSRILGYSLQDDDLMLLLLFCHLFVNNSDDNICDGDYKFLYPRRDYFDVRKSLLTGHHVLLENNLISYNNNDGFVNRESMRLSQKSKDELLSELSLPTTNEDNYRGDLLRHEELQEKQLFYPQRVGQEVDELQSLLTEKNYQDIKERLKETNFRSGFTCLFYGAPGTGKTETAMQLARMTGRDIMQVNISEVKSMWVGESEKNIKGIFDKYRQKVSQNKVAPILLFNEADGIIGKRMKGAERSVEKMDNSIQNIILQELETLDGIFIATTNLAENMDRAFERRFLYKIKFEKPDVACRTNIWMTMMKGLDEKIARNLADRYDFSGGQIENVSRHYAIDSILHGEPSDVLKTLLRYCDSEQLEKETIRKIGF